MRDISATDTVKARIEKIFSQLKDALFVNNLDRLLMWKVFNKLAAKETDVERFLLHLEMLKDDCEKRKTGDTDTNITITSTQRFKEIKCDIAYVIEI